MRRVKKRIFSGAVCEQVVYNVSDRGDVKKAKPQKPRFKDEAEREAHRIGIARRRFIRLVNSNFTPAGFFATLTLDAASECHDFAAARILRKNYARRLLYKFPEAKIIIVMGRGRSTSRIHFHMLIEAEGLTAENVAAAWRDGSVIRIDHLREHNRYEGVDHGRDYTAVASYMFEHWTTEQGGHYAYCSRTLSQPEEETPREIVREYTPDKPPVEPKGFRFVSCTWNRYGYMIFKYVKEDRKTPKRAACN